MSVIFLVNYSYILLVMLGYDPKVLCTYGRGRNRLPFFYILLILDLVLITAITLTIDLHVKTKKLSR